MGQKSRAISWGLSDGGTDYGLLYSAWDNAWDRFMAIFPLGIAQRAIVLSPNGLVSRRPRVDVVGRRLRRRVGCHGLSDTPGTALGSCR